jgi:hypothetical protein
VKTCRIAAARGCQIALSQRVDGKKKISFADLALTFERTLACDYVDFAKLGEREAVGLLDGQFKVARKQTWIELLQILLS